MSLLNQVYTQWFLYASLVSSPYSHIFMENFRKEIQKLSTKKKVNYNNTKKKKDEGGTIETEPSPMHEPPRKPLPADNLKSALKSSTSVGSKKNGISVKKVTWAPDVYDPPPLSESHYAPASSNRGSSNGTTSGTDEYWHGSQNENQMKGKKWQHGVVDKDAGESVERNCFKNVSKKSGKKNVTKVGGGKGGTERGVEMHESESNKSQQKEVEEGSHGGKDKDMKQGGRAGEKGAKDKDKKFGKSKGAKI